MVNNAKTRLLCGIVSAAAICLSAMPAPAQNVYEITESYTTYGFSDPDPVPRTSEIYPYFRYDGFEKTGTERDWKVVVLENEYLRVKVFPEIGGKIWSVYDKKQGGELFYDNDVVKFRDISLRGPWTSGGIEFNYGVIGHAPSCSFPVDYLTRSNADGSVSCFISVSELLTRTRWTIEINLPKDAAYVRTRSFWHNASGTFQPYYNWANSGIKTSDDMRIIYPARYAIGHGGTVEGFPVDEQGRDISVFANQAYGADKSYHAGGSHKEFFGAIWPSENFGMLHWALRDEKLGRKYFSWAQSEQGSIWIDLLTDNRPQYVEMQSGRLYNQNNSGSESTPYKQILFAPYGTDEWDEYWMPFSGISNVDGVSSRAVVGIEGEAIKIYSVRSLRGRLRCIAADGTELMARDIDTRPEEVAVLDIDPATVSKITLDGEKLWSSAPQDLKRPNSINPQFVRSSAQGQAVLGEYCLGTRQYATALDHAESALALDPSFIQALNLKAVLELRRMNYDEAVACADKVLATDTYDARANYASGLAYKEMGDVCNAMDRLEMAALTQELRGAACTELAKIHFREGERELAGRYARKALGCNYANVTAYEILYQLDASDAMLSVVSELDPLGHFAEIEGYLSGRLGASELAAGIREEMRFQNYIEAAAFYISLGLDDKARRIIGACPDRNILTGLWEAWLCKDASMIDTAEELEMNLVFPFRQESARVLEWAIANGGGWKCRYLSAMLQDHLGNRDAAEAAIEGVECAYAPFYAFRASLNGKREDLARAVSLDPEQWRYVNALVRHYYDNGDYESAIRLCEPYCRRHKDNYRIAETLVSCYMAVQEYSKADKVMETMDVLPFEGQRATRNMYRSIKLHLAAEAIDSGRYTLARKLVARAREWPVRLGAGKPYDALIDTSAEDWLDSVIDERLSSKAPYGKVAPELEKHIRN